MQGKLVSLISGLLFTSLILCYHPAKANLDESSKQVALRMVAHQLLLEMGDSSSVIPPIKKLEDSYQISFNRNFSLNPDILVSQINSAMHQAEINAGYFVEVYKCEMAELVYSYKVSNLDSASMIPCIGRQQEYGCYNILIRFIPEQQTVLTNSNLDNSPSKNADTGVNYLAFGLIPIVGLALFLWLRSRKKLNPNLIRLGEFFFDPIRGFLEFKQEQIELSAKESSLLQLLYSNQNETVDRDMILNQVWGDEGDYVGRTLDVFISKLRKKLELDPQVKIVNTRGVGYKLILA